MSYPLAVQNRLVSASSGGLALGSHPCVALSSSRAEEIGAGSPAKINFSFR